MGSTPADTTYIRETEREREREPERERERKSIEVIYRKKSWHDLFSTLRELQYSKGLEYLGSSS